MQTEVISTEWDEDARRWLVTTNRQDCLKARFVVHSNGPLIAPNCLQSRVLVHTKATPSHSRWDYAYTGGDSHGNLDNLSDKRVAIIGTGATAVQCIPHLSRRQRTFYSAHPSSIDVRNNQATDPDWISTQQPGWQDERRTNFESLMTGFLSKRTW